MAALVVLAVSASALARDTELADQEGRFNDEPSMVRAVDGSLYISQWDLFALPCSTIDFKK